jgi:hypothetical protein
MLDLQRGEGAWPAFVGDSEASWTTALMLCALNGTGEFTSAREKAFHWLVAERGREAHWLWRWKFKTTDRNVRFDPDKYGWPWISGSASRVIPTAFSIIALKQFTVCNRSEASEKRIHLGVEMLLDRACVDGGWNSGNSIVYRVPLRPHVEATAIANLHGLAVNRHHYFLSEVFRQSQFATARQKKAGELGRKDCEQLCERNVVRIFQEFLDHARFVQVFSGCD